MRCVVIDAGNTSVVTALVENGRVRGHARTPTATRDRGTLDAALAQVAGGRQIDAAVIGSVVPPLNSRWRAAVRRVLRVDPLFVSSELDLGVGLSYPRPERIGADRLANASAAVVLYRPPAIVADFGTALTFDVIDARGVYIGGVIAPGLPFVTDYLAEKTALLPRVDLRGRCGRVGRSTSEAMRIGAKIGYRGMVREIVVYLSKGMRAAEVQLCATGGLARWALQDSDMPFVFNPELTLLGLARIGELNFPFKEG
jgi:type III pantothenate kinase